MSTLNAKSPENPNQTSDLSDFETTTNQEINNINSKSEQVDLSSFEPQLDQLFHIDGMYIYIINMTNILLLLLYQ